jgi:hypothetical protein
MSDGVSDGADVVIIGSGINSLALPVRLRRRRGVSQGDIAYTRNLL